MASLDLCHLLYVFVLYPSIWQRVFHRVECGVTTIWSISIRVSSLRNGIKMIASVVLACFLIASLVRALHIAFRSPLGRIPPAHWSVAWSSLWILWIRYARRENRTIHAAHQRLGPVVRLAPNEISVNDLDGIRTIYTGGWEKHPWYLLFRNYWG